MRLDSSRPPRTSSCGWVRAKSASALAAPTRSSPQKVTAVGPASRPLTSSRPARSAAMPPRVFLTTLKRGAALAQLAAQLAELGDGEAAVVADEQVLRVRQKLRHLGDHSFFLVSQHLDLSVANKNPLPKRKRAQAAALARLASGGGPAWILSSSRGSTDRHRPRRRSAAMRQYRRKRVRPQLPGGRARSSQGSSRSRVRAGSSSMPGLIVAAMVTLLMYFPLAAAGLARTISSSTAP